MSKNETIHNKSPSSDRQTGASLRAAAGRLLGARSGPGLVICAAWSSTWFWSCVKAEQRNSEREKLPEQHHVPVPQLRLVPEGTDRVHQVRHLCCSLSADPIDFSGLTETSAGRSSGVFLTALLCRKDPREKVNAVFAKYAQWFFYRKLFTETEFFK